MEKFKLKNRAVRVFSICLILMLVLPIISVFFVSAAGSYQVYWLGDAVFSGSNTFSANITFYYESYSITCTYAYRQHNTNAFGGSYDNFSFYQSSSSQTYYVKFSYGRSQSTTAYYRNCYVYMPGMTRAVSISLGSFVSEKGRILNGLTSNNTFPSNSYLSLHFESLGYTLTFDSQGGSAINPIEGIEEGETILLGDSTGYFPEYVPTKMYQNFEGWSLTEDGPIVRQVTVTADTTLYAQWSLNGRYSIVNVTPVNGFDYFLDDEMSEICTFPRYVETGDTFTFYAYYSGPEYFTGKLNLIGNYAQVYNTVSAAQKIVAVTDQVYPYLYKFDLNVDRSFTFQPVLSEMYEVYGYPYIESSSGAQIDKVDNVAVSVVYPDGYRYLINPYDWQNRDVFYVPSGGYFLFKADIIPPYVVGKSYYLDSNLESAQMDDVNLNSSIIETNLNEYKFFIRLEAKVYPTFSGFLSLHVRNITDYDPHYDRDPLVVTNESGDPEWNFSEVSLLDTNWSAVDDLIPHKLDGFFDGLYGLPGLSILIPLVMMVSFAIWFIRRS